MSKNNIQGVEEAQAPLEPSQVQSIVAAMFDHASHVNVSVNYDSAAPRIELTGSAGGAGGGTTLTQEEVEDMVAQVITAGGLLTETYDDAGNSLGLSADLSTVPDLTQDGGTISGVINIANGTFTLDPTALYPSPVIDVEPIEVLQASTDTIRVTGEFFTPATTVTANGAGFSAGIVTFISTSEIDVLITVPAGVSTSSITITNEGGSTTSATTKIETFLSNWLDLRDGGDIFTVGNAPGNDVRHRSTGLFVRDTVGITQQGSDFYPWLKFHTLEQTRAEEKTTSFIFKQTAGKVLFGLSAVTTNESSTTQYEELDIGGYMANINEYYGLVGAITGQPATAWALNPLSPRTSLIVDDYYRIEITLAGKVGGLVNLYRLPSGSTSDWDNTSQLIESIAIPSTSDDSEQNLLPFVATSSNCRIVAARSV